MSWIFSRRLRRRAIILVVFDCSIIHYACQSSGEYACELGIRVAMSTTTFGVRWSFDTAQKKKNRYPNPYGWYPNFHAKTVRTWSGIQTSAGSKNGDRVSTHLYAGLTNALRYPNFWASNLWYACGSWVSKPSGVLMFWYRGYPNFHGFNSGNTPPISNAVSKLPATSVKLGYHNLIERY